LESEGPSPGTRLAFIVVTLEFLILRLVGMEKGCKGRF